MLAHRRVLVLNKMWTAIRIASLEDALVKLIGEYENGKPKAKIIDPSDYQLYTWEDWSQLCPEKDEDVIKGVRKEFKIPEVILVDYDKMPHHRVRFSRRMLYKRDNFTCQYCAKQLPSEELNIDHVIPRAQGGETTWLNCCVSCVPCNSRKNNRTPEQAHMHLIHPLYKPKFSLFKSERRQIPTSWQKFISEMYWNIELENDEH